MISNENYSLDNHLFSENKDEKLNNQDLNKNDDNPSSNYQVESKYICSTPKKIVKIPPPWNSPLKINSVTKIKPEGKSLASPFITVREEVIKKNITPFIQEKRMAFDINTPSPKKSLEPPMTNFKKILTSEKKATFQQPLMNFSMESTPRTISKQQIKGDHVSVLSLGNSRCSMKFDHVNRSVDDIKGGRRGSFSHSALSPFGNPRLEKKAN